MFFQEMVRIRLFFMHSVRSLLVTVRLEFGYGDSNSILFYGWLIVGFVQVLLGVAAEGKIRLEVRNWKFEVLVLLPVLQVFSKVVSFVVRTWFFALLLTCWKTKVQVNYLKCIYVGFVTMYIDWNHCCVMNYVTFGKHCNS